MQCESEIRGVVVYARGAVVTRGVRVGGLPDGDAELFVDGLPYLSEPGSLRVELRAKERRVVSVESVLVVPEEAAEVAEGERGLIELRAKIARAQSERQDLAARRQSVLGLQLQPGLAVRGKGFDVAERTRDAMGVHALASELLAAADRRDLELHEQLLALERELERAVLAHRAASTAARARRGQARRAARIHLEGAGPIEALELSYVVPGARWWPLYTLELVEAGARASFWVEALVVQASGEDWRGVSLGLSTSDLVRDARLPELRSRRLGKAQPPRRSGYRPLPADLERMFAGWDRGGRGLESPPEVPDPVTIPPPYAQSGAALVASDYELAEGSSGMDDEDTDAEFGEDVLMSRRGQTASYELAAAPPPAPAARASPAPSVRGAAPKKAARRMEEEPEMMRAMSVPMASYGGGGPPGSPPPPPEPEPSVEEDPSEGWLDFDRLRMAGPGAAGRGRLFVPHDASRDALEGSADAIEVVAPGATVLDPRAARGHYDYRWDASARSTVPSDGLVHRVRLGSYAAKPRYRFWTIPREVAEVFREAFVDNPTPGPLLGGPVDVYVEGSLLTTAPAAHVDRGGVLRVGLGVEERLKVARNVRVEEDAAGLLGGSTEVDHHVSIELVSSLGQPATIEVYDRVPVSDEKGLEIKRVAEDPKSEVYKQEDRGRPIRGGLCWKIPLAPGGARTVKLHYRLAFSSKQEIVGGNRRD